MAEKSYFEQLQEQAAAQAAAAKERGPALGVGPHSFTIIGGTHGSKEGREWSAVVVRHTNGHEYRIFYNLYWPLKEGELEQRLNIKTFDWIVGFDPKAITSYKGADFDDFFNSLSGRSYELKYTLNKKGSVVVDFEALPVLLDALEEELTIDEINFDAVE